MPSFPDHHQLPALAQTHVHQVSDAIQASHHLYPVLLLPSIFPIIRVFSNESVLRIRCQRIGVSASASVLSMNIQELFPLGLTGLISLLFKGLSSLFQHHSLKASVLQRSAFFMVQLSHLYVTTGKNRALTTWTFVGKVMALHFTTLSRFVSFLSKEQTSFNFMVAVTIHSNFEA